MPEAKPHEKVLILTERFYPEEFLINDLAVALKESGMTVEVLTQVPSYPHDRVFTGYSNRLFQTTEEFNGIKIHRVKTYCGYNKSVFKKIFNYLNFALLTSLWCMFCGYRFKRVFIYHTGPLTMASAAVVMRFFWRRQCVIWTQDIWPDAVYAYGFKPTWWKKLLLDSFVRIIYSACDRVIVSSPGFEKKLSGYTSRQVEFLPQWNQIDFNASSVPGEGVKDKRIFTFAGNLGTAQNLEALIEAFGELRLTNCVLQLVGGGIMLEPLQELVKQKGYDNIAFTGRLPQDQMPQIFAASDVMIISLKDKYSMTVPAKFQAYIAAGKPILGIIGGDTAELIKEHDIGIAVEQDRESIQKAFCYLARCDVKTIRGWQVNSLKLSEEKFNRTDLIGRIKDMLSGIPDRHSISSPVNSRAAWWLVGILMLSTALIVMQHLMEPEMGRDSTLSLIVIEKWSSGGFSAVLDYWPEFWLPPLLLHSAVLLTYLGISAENAALFICMGCGILMPLVSFAIAHELFRDKRISLAAALFTALNPSIIKMSIQAQRDVPYLFFAGWCIFFLIAAIRRQKWFYWCLAGCVWGMAVLIRFEMIEFFPILGMYFIVAVFNQKQQWLACLKKLLVFAVSGIAVMTMLLYVSGTENVILKGYNERIIYHLQRFNVFDGGGRK